MNREQARSHGKFREQARSHSERVGFVGASLLAIFACLSNVALAAPATLDPVIQASVERARSAFMATQTFKRLNLSVWVQDAPGQPWRGGEVDAEAQVYPASIVKLPFAIDSVITCVERQQAPDCQRKDLVPMVVDSDNVATGWLVDGLTQTIDHHDAPLLPGVQAVLAPTDPAEKDAAFATWLAARRHTERRLESLGLRGGMRLFSKTYPTNSGEEPMGFEARARRELGRNTMSAHDAAALLRALVDGEIDRAAKAPVLATLTPLLTRSRFSLQSALSPGEPPGTRHLGKIGSAYDTLEEVAVLDWPQGPSRKRVLIAAYSDGLDQDAPEPFDGWRLGGLTALLLQELGLAPAQEWQKPTMRRGPVVEWKVASKLAPTTQHEIASKLAPTMTPDIASKLAPTHTIELQYRFPTGQPGLRRVRVGCAPDCQPANVAWTFPAQHVAARPLWLGAFQRGAKSELRVEVELESAGAAPGELLVVP